MKLSKHHVSSRRDSHYFANRVINIWNPLPYHIIVSPSVATFRRKLSKFHFNEQPLFLYLFPFFYLGHLSVQLFVAFVSRWHTIFLFYFLAPRKSFDILALYKSDYYYYYYYYCSYLYFCDTNKI